MLKLALAALILGAASAVSAPSPPLCRVQALSHDSFMPPVRDVLVFIRQPCPDSGVAFVQLRSSSGATDPPDGGFKLLSRDSPSVLYRGVLPHWGVYWRARSGKVYRVTEQ